MTEESIKMIKTNKIKMKTIKTIKMAFMKNFGKFIMADTWLREALIRFLNYKKLWEFEKFSSLKVVSV